MASKGVLSSQAISMTLDVSSVVNTVDKLGFVICVIIIKPAGLLLLYIRLTDKNRFWLIFLFYSFIGLFNPSCL